MSATRVLLDVLIVLLAAKAAVEIAERLGVPAVIGEILAGLAIGPSALGIVEGGEVLHVLGELGVILLLLDVGLEMDLGELGAVGRASLAVAFVGVVLPFATGLGAGELLGLDGKQAIFVGAALTATSVGITARVFADLRALASVEARTVLGAAVADDVIGLMILTVVVKVVTGGSVSPMTVGLTIALAVGFLVLTTAVGMRTAPLLFRLVARHSRSTGTFVAVALAFALLFSELASLAGLAPIVGAFVAGLSLGRGASADRVRRELAPVGHLLVPVFFLQIGIDAELSKFADVSVLTMAGVLLAVAVVGKVLSPLAMGRAPGDRLVVGLGMLPRGEVGLIFATIGLRRGVFDGDVYAALVLVVLVTTVVTPPALRARLLRLRTAGGERRTTGTAPQGGWFAVDLDAGTVDLVAEPPPGDALVVALQAGLAADNHAPGPKLLDWLANFPPGLLRWTPPAREAFFVLLQRGGSRAWRLLVASGLLQRALPELGEALEHRARDPFDIDPLATVDWPRLGRVQPMADEQPLAHPERLLLAAAVLDITGDDERSVVTARRLVQRLDLGAAAEQSVAGLVADRGLLSAAARRPASFTEEPVLRLAVHLGSAEQARSLHLLTRAELNGDLEGTRRVGVLHDLVQDALAHPELVGRDASNLVERRRAEARRLTQEKAVHERIDAAGRTYVLTSDPVDIARHARLCEPPPGRNDIRCVVTSASAGRWTVDFALSDRVGLLAHETQALGEAGLDVVNAVAFTWGDGCALASFGVVGAEEPDGDALGARLAELLAAPPVSDGRPDAAVAFDESSPWHTVCEVRGPDRAGFLHAVTVAFASAGATVHAARIGTVAGEVSDVFELTDASGHKLSGAMEKAVRRAIRDGVGPRTRRWWPLGPRG